MAGFVADSRGFAAQGVLYVLWKMRQAYFPQHIQN